MNKNDILIQVNDKEAFMGMGGMGKTAGAKERIFKASVEKNKPVIAFDYEGEFAKTHIRNSSNIHFVHSPKELISFLANYNHVWRATNMVLVFQDETLYQDEELKIKSFEKLVWWIFNNFTDFVWFFDEIDAFWNKHKTKTPLSSVMSLSRNRGLDLLFTFKRLQSVHNNLLGGVSKWNIYKMVLPNDIDIVGKYIGKDTAEKVKKLDRFQCIYFDIEKQLPKIKIIDDTILSYI